MFKLLGIYSIVLVVLSIIGLWWFMPADKVVFTITSTLVDLPVLVFLILSLKRKS